MAVFEYKNGVSFAKTFAAEIGGFGRRQLVVTGSKGNVEIKPLETFVPGEKVASMVSMRREFDREAGDWSPVAQSEEYGRYAAMMTAFAAMVRGERKNPYTYEYEWMLYRILLRACGVDIDYKAELDL